MDQVVDRGGVVQCLYVLMMCDILYFKLNTPFLFTCVVLLFILFYLTNMLQAVKLWGTLLITFCRVCLSPIVLKLMKSKYHVHLTL